MFIVIVYLLMCVCGYFVCVVYFFRSRFGGGREMKLRNMCSENYSKYIVMEGASMIFFFSRKIEKSTEHCYRMLL